MNRKQFMVPFLLGQRRELIVLAGIVALPATWLIGRVATIWQLTLLALVWLVLVHLTDVVGGTAVVSA